MSPATPCHRRRLTYLNNRYYDPGIGNFVSVDPLVGKTGTPYVYANGNPSTLSDPSGGCVCQKRDGDGGHYFANWQSMVARLTPDQLVEFKTSVNGAYFACDVGPQTCADWWRDTPFALDSIAAQLQRGDSSAGSALATWIMYYGVSHGLSSGQMYLDGGHRLGFVNESYSLAFPPLQSTDSWIGDLYDIGVSIAANGASTVDGIALPSAFESAQESAMEGLAEAPWGGFVGGISKWTALTSGTRISRVGGDGHHFGLPGQEGSGATSYVVRDPLAVRIGPAASWNGSTGGTPLIYSEASTQQLIASGAIVLYVPPPQRVQ